MDPNNPVIKLCVAGMEAEGEGRFDEARALFLQAWEAHQDDFEGCIAAHYVARHQSSAQATLDWNQRALTLATQVTEQERVAEFYPSLYLNLGHSYEQLGDAVAARHYYELAAARVASLPDSPYKHKVTNGISAGQSRQHP